MVKLLAILIPLVLGGCSSISVLDKEEVDNDYLFSRLGEIDLYLKSVVYPVLHEVDRDLVSKRLSFIEETRLAKYKKLMLTPLVGLPKEKANKLRGSCNLFIMSMYICQVGRAKSHLLKELESGEDLHLGMSRLISSAYFVRENIRKCKLDKENNIDLSDLDSSSLSDNCDEA